MTQDKTGAALARRKSGTVDHIALGVPDLEAAARALEARAGAPVHISPREPGQWYQSASLPLGADCFLEIVGPNPDWRGFHPFRTVLRGLDRPEPVFWYVATDDLDAFAARAEAAGAPLERVEWINRDDDPGLSQYRRAVIGPGFRSQRPCVIQWIRKRARQDGPCRLNRLQLHHPKAAGMNASLSACGVRERVEVGAPKIRVEIDAPQGPLVFEGSGLAFAGPGAGLAFLGLFFAWLAGRR